MLSILGKRTSINVRKVLWACEEAGLEYQQEDYGSGFQPTDTAAFLALNPNGLVPVLLDDDMVLWESNSICRYLARKAGREDLLPVAPRQAADVERWMDWQATEFNNAWRYAFMGLVRKDPRFQDPVALKESIAAWTRCVQIVESQLQHTGGWVTGAHFTLADIVLGLSVHRWKMTPFAHPEMPAVEHWYMALNQRPAFMRHGNNGTA
ncbi:glutathione S-transferase [Raoultella sp. BIGb0399]|uniref:glutathione S-transferase family protein n=1 Tax=Raoultella sp. BIGb0399 TaxID=2485119 RepID=UPI000F4C6FFD|nr:glutathione S-transferase family protein [Raoultella sp. BIGb0399]ROS10075.1 glutathione S-transferase [Raoultella sp. BIGb0399]